jgi:tRNA uridine 5-carboxymethylaminomethyl modification enzyme
MGPRYCPSIEDKIIKFKTNPKHKVFLEPESLKTDEWYVSGVSNSLPLKLQYKLLKNIKGLEGCFITKPGYSIQYDYIPSVNITPSLECKNVKGLFLAGQINGTTGYEEAASQGLVAGLNASLYVLNEKPVYFKGENSYIGVLVNDIASKEVLEPYRVFTYRADNRLVLNYESACFRMLSISKAYMLLGKDVIHNLTLQNKLIQS